MAQMSDYMENVVLKLILGQGGSIAQATRYLAIFNTTQAKIEAGSLVDELSGSNYSRIALVGTVIFGTPTVGNCSNITDIVSPVASALWATATHLAIMDASTGGTVFLWIPVPNPGQVAAGKQLKVLAGTLTINGD